jgi:flavin-dependent dehydrogenase
MFLRYAERCGVKVFEGTKVMELEFDGTSRPVAAYHANTGTGSVGKITFDYLIDSSGRTGIMSTKYLKNRQFNPSFKNIATWGYWKGVKSYKPDDERLKGFPFFEALNDNSGWAWLFPLHNGHTSIGLVMNQDALSQKKKASSAANTREFYREELMKRAPTLVELIGEGQLVEGDQPSTTVRSASDYSYSAKSYAGPYYRLVGDAACFIDPYFSSGIHLAQTSGLSAAATILASIKGNCSEDQASEWHNQRVDISYTRFLVVVLTAYRQIRAQDTPILSEISEDGFDRAFDHFRSIIQGRLDAQQQLAATAPNLRQTIDFCKAAFDSSTSTSCPPSPSNSIPPQIPCPIVTSAETPSSSISACSSTRPGPKEEEDSQKVVYHTRAPPLASSVVSAEVPQKGNSLGGTTILDFAVKNVITQTTAMRFMTTGESFMIDNLISDEILGMKLSLQVGNLGLTTSPLS